MNVLVSACLLGNPCRYDGRSKPCEGVIELRNKVQFVPICPEILGGLSIPHPASEIKNGRVVSAEGKDVTGAFCAGAQKALAIAQKYHCTCALLKERSPSCGCKEIYDGSFSGKLVSGNGITAELLLQNGILVFGESEIEKLQKML